MSRRRARAGVSSGWWSMTRSTSPNGSSKKLGWASTIATMSYSSIACALISSTSISRMRVIARFSGRVIVPNVAMGAAALERPRSVRSANAEAIASGSGSSCIMMSTRSAGAKWLRSRSTRFRAEARKDVRSRMLTQKYAPPAAGDKQIYPRNFARKSRRARLAWTRRRRPGSVARGPVSARGARSRVSARGSINPYARTTSRIATDRACACLTTSAVAS